MDRNEFELFENCVLFEFQSEMMMIPFFAANEPLVID
jgi:hypothetical protein